MTWDSKEDAAIRRAKLKVSSPEVAYQALKSRGEWIEQNHFPTWLEDDAVEQILHDRDDPLINLALAQYACSGKVVADLYARNQLNGNDEKYSFGVRIACLSNRLTPNGWFFDDAGEWMGEQQLAQLIDRGDESELVAWLQNPSAGKFLGQLYQRKELFAAVSNDRWYILVRASIPNPRINIDKGTEDGPDMSLWDIQDGIVNLLRTAPAEENWLHVLRYLLLGVDPQNIGTSKSDIDDILDRWGRVSIKNSFGENKDQEEQGTYTPLTLVQEFCCLVAALYGKKWADNKFEILGNPNSESTAQRCAFYGNAEMSVEEMRMAIAKDEKIFVFAALCNGNMFWNRNRRVALEEALRGSLRYIYVQRCQQMHTRRLAFDPMPVTEFGAELLDDIVASPKSSEEIVAIARLEGLVKELTKQLGTVRNWVTWGFIALAIAVFWPR